MESVTAAEHAAGRLDDAKVARLGREFAERGVSIPPSARCSCRLTEPAAVSLQFVVLANVIPDTAVLSSLEASLDLAAAVQVLQENYHTSRTQLGPLLPRTAPWVRPEINANPLVEQVVVRLLKGEAFIRWHGSNTSLPMPPDAPPLSAEAAAGWEAAPEDGAAPRT